MDLRTDIVKFRQGGVTSAVMAMFIVECMDPRQVAQCVMIAHDKDHTEKLLRRAQFFIDHMNEPKPSILRANDNEIIFKKTGSAFFIGTAGSKQFGRSATITHLHGSEVAFWPNPKDLMAGLMQAIPSRTGIIIKESTGNGWGTWHHQNFMRAYNKGSRFKGLFFPWFIFKEYQLQPDPGFEITEDEEELIDLYNLTPAQLQWRRYKIEELDFDIDLFNQEYPSTVEDAFRLTGGSLFPDVKVVHSKNWTSSFKYGVRLATLDSHPSPSLHYVIGADPAGGTGNDNAAIQVVCAETLEQVARFADNRINPLQFGRLLAKMGRAYNDAFIVCERNNHGYAVLATLKEEEYPRNKIYKHKTPLGKTGKVEYGWQNSTTTKPFVIGLTIRYLDVGLTLYDLMTVDGLRGFNEDPDTNKMEGTEDNVVISLALACLGLRKLGYLIPIDPTESKEEEEIIERPAFLTLEWMLNNIKEKKRSQGLAAQLRKEWVQ